jgi:hypothetical protein
MRGVGEATLHTIRDGHRSLGVCVEGRPLLPSEIVYLSQPRGNAFRPSTDSSQPLKCPQATDIGGHILNSPGQIPPRGYVN